MVLNRGLNEGAVKCERVYDTQLLFSHSSKSTQWDGLAMLARPASKNTASFLAKENLVRVVKISKKSNSTLRAQRATFELVKNVNLESFW